MKISLTLRIEHRLREFEKCVLRRIFGPRKEEVIGMSSDSHNEELNIFYSSLNVIPMSASKIVRKGENVA